MRRRKRAHAALVVCALTLAPLVAAQARAEAAVTAVWYRGDLVVVQGEATVRSALAQAGARPAHGRLVDILGGVIDPGAFPPTYLLNGASVAADASVANNDTVDYTDGVDATEPSVVETYARPEGDPARTASAVRERVGSISGVVEPLPPPAEPFVVLTFDDGPHPRWTPAVLDALEAAGAKATFFTVGALAARWPDLVRRQIDAGMTIGNHTWDHANVSRSAAVARDQMRRASDNLAALGVRSAFFRPPYARYSAATLEVARELGMRTVMWSVDPKDWRRRGARSIADHVLAKVEPGSIVILHDGGGDRSQTVEALGTILEELSRRGYLFLELR